MSFAIYIRGDMLRKLIYILFMSIFSMIMIAGCGQQTRPVSTAQYSNPAKETAADTEEAEDAVIFEEGTFEEMDPLERAAAEDAAEAEPAGEEPAGDMPEIVELD